MARVICPFCLKPHNFTSSLELVCPVHQEKVPADYASEYNQVPPLWLVAVGFSQHGKTTYLAALTLILENISKVWPGVYYIPLDQYTTEKIREMRREAREGKPPSATLKQEVSRPLLFSVYQLPETGSRCLVMYDIAGEIYNSIEEVQEYVPAIKRASTIWFLVSLADLESDQEGKMITELFNAYRSGMENLRIDLKGRNLIVVYTKGDILDLPKELEDYLESDPFKGLTRHSTIIPDLEDFSLSDYIVEMNNISDQLQEYTRARVRGGAAFINMVKAKGMNLRFCLTSALGERPDPSSQRLFHADAFRYRVLDPFLWATTLAETRSANPIGLVVDASQESRSVYDEALLSVIWERLSDYGEVATYYLGQTSPASRPGQQPPMSPPHVPHQRLIGPILENASPGSRFLVIGTGPITDLADFYDSPWRDQVLLVMMGEDYQRDWPNTLIYRNGDDPAVLVDALLRL
jgi:hypothetical protein